MRKLTTVVRDLMLTAADLELLAIKAHGEGDFAKAAVLAETAGTLTQASYKIGEYS